MTCFSSSCKVSKSAICEKMSFSRGSIYYKPRLPAKDLALKREIEVVMLEHKAYGYRRIAMHLGVNHKRVYRVMKLFNLKPKKLRKKPRLKKSKYPKNSAKNLILNIALSYPNQLWVSDFTYLLYQSRFIYLATVLDAFTREIVGWNISSRHNKYLVIEALESAINKRAKLPDIFHSDQGSEYRSNDLINILKSKKIKPSMSHKSSPWQNGKQESFYQKFKFEMDDLNYYENQGQLIEAIALQIHYYNNRRIHSALKMTPSAFYQRFTKKL